MINSSPLTPPLIHIQSPPQFLIHSIQGEAFALVDLFQLLLYPCVLDSDGSLLFGPQDGLMVYRRQGGLRRMHLPFGGRSPIDVINLGMYLLILPINVPPCLPLETIFQIRFGLIYVFGLRSPTRSERDDF